MKSIRKTLVGILTVILLAGFTALSQAKTASPTEDFLTGKWQGEQWGGWIGDIVLDLQSDTLTQKISGEGNVDFTPHGPKVYLKIEGELKDGNIVVLNIHYDRSGNPHNIIYTLTYKNGELKGDGTSPKGKTIRLTLKKSA